MAIPYTPPGVTSVTEISTSPLLPQGGVETIPALIGKARGFESFTETVLLEDNTPVELAKTGITLDVDDDVVSVIKTTTNEVIPQVNYVLSQTSPSGGSVEGDTVTTITREDTPDAVSLAVGDAGPLTGEYRYVAVWNYGGDVETGVDTGKAVSIEVSSEEVDISDIDTDAPTGATGRSIYRSKNLGTSGDPQWAPWYRVTTIADLITTTFTDDVDDATILSNKQASPGIEDGDSVFVKYNYADTEYYLPTLFENFSDIISKYGAPFDNLGEVDSELTFGANLAIINGASQVICVAVKSDATDSDFANALTKLLSEEDVDIVVSLSGTSTNLTNLSSHVNSANSENSFRIGIAGRDGVAATVTALQLRQNASSINNQNVQIVSPSIYEYFNGTLNKRVKVGGQFAAAALAGMYSARLPYETLTRKVLAGFSDVGEVRTKNSKNTDAANGLTVIEARSGILRIRHSISTSPADINSREISVTTAKFNMLKDVLAILDEEVVGNYYADELSPVTISAVVRQVLDRKVSLRIISGYQGLTASPVPGDPTTYNVEWQYKPTYPINNLSISFSINLNTGSVALTGAGLGGSSNLIL